jgi:hypothetical protein
VLKYLPADKDSTDQAIACGVSSIRINSKKPDAFGSFIWTTISISQIFVHGKKPNNLSILQTVIIFIEGGINLSGFICIHFFARRLPILGYYQHYDLKSGIESEINLG